MRHNHLRAPVSPDKPVPNSEQIRSNRPTRRLIAYVRWVTGIPGLFRTIYDEVKISSRIAVALVFRPRACPRCRSRKLDAMPRASASALLLDAIGFWYIRCHTCRQLLVTRR